MKYSYSPIYPFAELPTGLAADNRSVINDLVRLAHEYGEPVVYGGNDPYGYSALRCAMKLHYGEDDPRTETYEMPGVSLELDQSDEDAQIVASLHATTNESELRYPSRAGIPWLGGISLRNWLPDHEDIYLPEYEETFTQDDVEEMTSLDFRFLGNGTIIVNGSVEHHPLNDTEFYRSLSLDEIAELKPGSTTELQGHTLSGAQGLDLLSFVEDRLPRS